MAKQDSQEPQDPPSLNQWAQLIASMQENHKAQLVELASILRDGQSNGSPELTRAIAAIEKHVESTANLGKEVARTVTKSNAIGDDTGLTAFAYDPSCEFCRTKKPHPDVDRRPFAHPKEQLHFIDDKGERHPRRVFFADFPLREEMLTPLEIRLFNQFTKNLDARGGYEAGRGWSARITDEGSKLSVRVHCYTPDERTDLPPLAQILAELLNGRDAVDPVNLLATVAAMQQEIANMKARPSGRSA